MPMKHLDNLISGRIASPYDLNNKDDVKNLTKEQKSEVKSVSSISYVLLPLYGDKDTSHVYEGSNAFGAKTQVTELSGSRYSLAVNVGKQVGFGPSFLIASAPLPREKAEDPMPYLDMKLYWVVARPCGECLFGDLAQMGTIGEPTFDSPYSIKLVHQYVFGSLIAVRFIDRRDGSTVAISSGGH